MVLKSELLISYFFFISSPWETSRALQYEKKGRRALRPAPNREWNFDAENPRFAASDCAIRGPRRPASSTPPTQMRRCLTR